MDIISLQIKEGHEYLIKLTPLQLDVIPDRASVPVVNIAIQLVNKVEETNNARTLFQISAALNDYAAKYDVILYCYCDMLLQTYSGPYYLDCLLPKYNPKTRETIEFKITLE